MRFIVIRSVTLIIGTFVSLLFATAALAQSYRTITVPGDGKPLVVSLTPSDQGKQILLLSETSKASAQALTLKLEGLAGLSAELFGAVVASSTSLDSLNPDTDFTPLDMRDSAGKSISSIAIPSGSSGDSNGPPDTRSCLVRNAGPDLETLLFLYRHVFRDKTDEELCNMFYPPPGGGGGGGDSELLSASGYGFIFRSACSRDQKTISLVRISTSGLQSSDFDGTKSFTITVSLRSEDKLAQFWRLKLAEGFERGTPYFLAPALNTTEGKKYGAPGSDLVFIQEYSRDGALLKTDSRPTRALAGSVPYNIAKDVRVFMGRKSGGRTNTFTTVSFPLGKVYSQCIPPGSMNRCSTAYSRKHGITVCGPR